jgi:hypothetical protein
MSLFRAARLAYAGLLDSTPQPSPASSPLDSMQYEYRTWDMPSPAVQPRGPIIDSHPLGPILAATVRPALAKLDEKARQTQAICLAQASIDTAYNPEPLQACLAALSILHDIVSKTLLSTTHDPNPTPGIYNSHLPSPVDPDHTHNPTSRLSQISPWLRKYTASISSITPSQIPRRAIMSFVHKVPTAYLSLVEDMLTLIQTPTPTPTPTSTPFSSPPSTSSPSPSPYPYPSPSSPTSPHPDRGRQQQTNDQPNNPTPPHHLALEILTHWLALTLLLDNVWWIGPIGAYELTQITTALKSRSQSQSQREALAEPHNTDWDTTNCDWDWGRDRDREAAGGCWWPESMLGVWRALERHR